QHPGRFEARIEYLPAVGRGVTAVHGAPGQVHQRQSTLELPDPIAGCAPVPLHSPDQTIRLAWAPAENDGFVISSGQEPRQGAPQETATSGQDHAPPAHGSPPSHRVFTWFSTRRWIIKPHI